MQIRSYQVADESAVIALWEACGLTRPWNNPNRDISRKLTTQPELFLVGESDGQIVGTAMGGYDGHRGWVNYLAVSPLMRRQGLGRQIMQALERAMTELGCPKLNLQIRADNEAVVRFYQSIGYQPDPVISMGKRLIPD